MKTLLKAILLGVGASALFLLGALLLVPWLLRDNVVELLERQISERLDATVAFEDVDISLVSTFPALAIELVGIDVVGTGQFDGVTLASVQSLRADVDLLRLLRDEQLLIESAVVRGPELYLVIEEDGAANYDIVKPVDEVKIETGEVPEPFALRLQQIRIVQGTMQYRSPEAEVSIEGLEHEGSAEVEGADYSASSRTTVESLTVRFADVRTIDRATVSVDLGAVLRADEERLELDRLEVVLNELSGEVSGTVEWADGQVGLDLELESGKGQSIRALVSAIPAAYSSDLDGLRASGTYSLSAKVQGHVSGQEDHAPSFWASLRVRNGKLQRADLPIPLEDIELAATLAHPGGHLDEMHVDIHGLALRAGQSHVEGKLSISKPLTNLYLEAALNGRVDFTELSQAYPLPDDAELAGKLGFDLDLAAKGERVRRSSGWITATAFAYLPKNAPHFRVGAASLSLGPRATKVDSFYGTYGSSDLKVKGTLSPLTTVLRPDALVVGNLMLDSQFINLDDFLEGDVAEIPPTLDITITASATKLQRKKIVLSDMKGVVLIKDGEVKLTKVRSETQRKKVEALLDSLPKTGSVLQRAERLQSRQR